MEAAAGSPSPPGSGRRCPLRWFCVLPGKPRGCRGGLQPLRATRQRAAGGREWPRCRAGQFCRFWWQCDTDLLWQGWLCPRAPVGPGPGRQLRAGLRDGLAPVPVLAQKRLFLPWSGWERGQYELFPPTNEAAGGQETGRLLILPPSSLGSGSSALTREAARSVPPRAPLCFPRPPVLPAYPPLQPAGSQCRQLAAGGAPRAAV